MVCRRHRRCRYSRCCFVVAVVAVAEAVEAGASSTSLVLKTESDVGAVSRLMQPELRRCRDCHRCRRNWRHCRPALFGADQLSGTTIAGFCSGDIATAKVLLLLCPFSFCICSVVISAHSDSLDSVCSKLSPSSFCSANSLLGLCMRTAPAPPFCLHCFCRRSDGAATKVRTVR